MALSLVRFSRFLCLVGSAVTLSNDLNTAAALTRIKRAPIVHDRRFLLMYEGENDVFLTFRVKFLLTR